MPKTSASTPPAITNVLAERYASPAVKAIWSPTGRVQIERDYWIAVMKAQRDLGIAIPAAAIASYERVKDQIDLASIDARERVTLHDVKARIEEFNGLAGHQTIHLGLTSRDLTYDILITASQLPAAVKLVDRHPHQRFVLDHIAKPTIAGPPPADWIRDLTALAARPQVSCKFSGVVSEVRLPTWTPELLTPYFEVVLQAFGPQRLMFGSDWPVCLVRSEYDRWFNFVTTCTASLSEIEQTQILGQNAVEFYHL